MHPTAMINGALFFETYGRAMPGGTVADIGAQDVNGSLKSVCPSDMKYVGVDFVPGRGVDIVLDDPYRLPFEDGSFDIVVTNSCLEHSEMFWVLYLDILRVLKPQGLLYMNVPSNGDFHRYPVDCWRFYPDAGAALITWARRNGYEPLMLESYTSAQLMGPWNDFIAVHLKDATYASTYPNRMQDRAKTAVNARNGLTSQITNLRERSEDQSNLSYRLKKMSWQIRKSASRWRKAG